MTKNKLLILLPFAIATMAFITNDSFTDSLTNNNWISNKYAYRLNIGDTLKLTKTNSKGDLKFKQNGFFKGWELYGVCGNISKLGRLFFKNPKWEKQGEWKLKGQNEITMDLGGSYEILTPKLLTQKENYFEFVVNEKRKGNCKK
jgi:hypothetical protein